MKHFNGYLERMGRNVYFSFATTITDWVMKFLEFSLKYVGLMGGKYREKTFRETKLRTAKFREMIILNKNKHFI